MMNLRELLENPEFIQKVACTKASYKKDEVILTEDEESQDVYLILAGKAQVSTRLESDVDQLPRPLARLAADDIFGELSMFDGEPRSAEVVALTDCDIAKFDGPGMIQFLDEHPEIGYFVLREIFMCVVMRMRQNNIRTKTVLQLYLNEK